MSDLRELYQEVILDHNRRPRNFHVLEGANRTAEGYNPLCGDRLTLYLQVDGDVITNAAFQGSGCAISKASSCDRRSTGKSWWKNGPRCTHPVTRPVTCVSTQRRP